VKIPESVKVGPFTYTVEFVDDLADDADRNRKLYGQCRYGDQKILISRGTNPDSNLATFLHELIHAIDFTMQAGLKEKQVDRVAVGLTMVLRDNPQLREE
jgi:hypothetical protein